MRVDLYGLHFETPYVTFYLWSPWRAAALEHRLFESLTGLPFGPWLRAARTPSSVAATKAGVSRPGSMPAENSMPCPTGAGSIRSPIPAR